MKRFIYIVPFLFCAAVVTAQTETKTERTIVVEKEYNPDINDADKINVLPKTEKRSVPETEVEYSRTPNVYEGRFAFSPLALAYKPQEPDKAKQFYMYAGYGNNGMADAGLYYDSPLFRNNELKFSAVFDGVNDSRNPFEGISGAENRLWDSRYYRTESNLKYVHHFDIMKLYVDGNFGLDNFNYRPSADGSFIDDRQRHTKLGARVGIQSDDFNSLVYNIFVDYSFFDKAYNNEKGSPANNENIVKLNALLGYKFGGSSLIGLDFKAYNYNYSMSGVDDFTTINLNPSYKLSRDNMSLMLGLNMDVAINSGARFSVSPDVSFDCTFASKYNVYLNATGRRSAVDYRFLEKMNPYWNPNFMEVGPEENGNIDLAGNYKTLSSNLGIKGSPFDGFRFDISAGFDMNSGDILIMPFTDINSASQYSEMVQKESNVIYGALELSYAYKDIFGFSANTRMMKWGKADDRYLVLKPKYEVGINLDTQIIRNMFLNLSYNYIGRTDSSVAGNINDLSAKLSYRFFKGLGAYVRATNIVSAENNYYYAYPSSDFTILLGLDFEF